MDRKRKELLKRVRHGTPPAVASSPNTEERQAFLRHPYKSDFGKSMWIPLLPSTSCVTRRLPAREHSM